MKSDTECEILGTGLVLVGRGIRSFDAVLRESIIAAEDEIAIAAYTITPSALDIFSLLKYSLEKDLEVKIVVNQFDKLDTRVQDWLLETSSVFESFFLFDFTPRVGEGYMHAKVIVIDRKFAFVGSTNLSHHGLVTGHEIAVKITGESVLQIANAVEKLMNDDRVIRRGHNTEKESRN